MEDKLSTTLPTEYTSGLDPQNTVNTEVQLFDLDLDDDQLIRICSNQLEDDINHWEKEPWLLSLTDKENIAYLLGIQKDSKVSNPNTETPYVDNRLFTAVRATLAYVTGHTAKPDLLPSKTDDKYLHIARQTGLGLYQHALDHDANKQFRIAVKNLIARKRGCIKLRYDEDYGPFGDIITENVDPADIVVGRFSKYGKNPERIYHKQKASIQELCNKFPDKKDDIFALYGFKRGTYSQVSRVITYWECWFTYYDNDGEAEGLCWFIPNTDIILGKMQNPNWIYKGSKKTQKITNMTDSPIKPFIWFNYWNTGRSFIDETCLFDQGRPLQDILNKRGRQIVENADYANPRILANGRLWDESDAKKFVNKNAKTIGLLNNMDPDANINNAVMVIQPSQLPSFVMEDKLDARVELDTMMGTPTQFQGANSSNSNATLGQDLLIKNQAGALQDDLVSVVNHAWETYYTYLVQMMNTYLTDDYYVMTKGKDGDYNHIMLNNSTIDTNVRVTVTVDSTLPLDKQAQAATAVQLAQMQRIDDLSLFEMLGLPDPEKLAERKLRWEIDRYTYMESIEQKLLSAEAEADITMIINGKTPEDRDDYDEDYLNHWNLFMTKPRFLQLPPKIKVKLVDYLHMIANRAAMTQGLTDSMLNPAGIIDRPPIMPLPKRTENIRLQGMMSPQQTAQIAGGEAQLAIPLSQLQAAQSPQGGNQMPGQGSAPAPVGQASPPKMVNPSQFGTH